MSCVNVTNVSVLDNPSNFTNPFQFEITFECLAKLDHGGLPGSWWWCGGGRGEEDGRGGARRGGQRRGGARHGVAQVHGLFDGAPQTN